jgi:hypothetical protein
MNAIPFIWVGLSILAVLLSTWASWHGFKEARARNREEDRALQRHDPEEISLGRQQRLSGWLLFWVHIAFLVHQALFLYVGVEAVREPGPAMQEDATLRQESRAYSMLTAQFLIVGSQILLVINTGSQVKIRKILDLGEENKEDEEEAKGEEQKGRGPVLE